MEAFLCRHLEVEVAQLVIVLVGHEVVGAKAADANRVIAWLQLALHVGVHGFLFVLDDGLEPGDLGYALLGMLLEDLFPFGIGFATDQLHQLVRCDQVMLLGCFKQLLLLVLLGQFYVLEGHVYFDLLHVFRSLASAATLARHIRRHDAV